jgi:hypothetical protein
MRLCKCGGIVTDEHYQAAKAEPELRPNAI